MKPIEDELLPTRRSLLARLKNSDDHGGWQEFFDNYWRLIFSVARKAGLSESESEEVVQETIVAVSKQMAGFEYDAKGSFKAWLLRITQRRIVDQFRKRPPWENAFAVDPASSTSGTRPVDRLAAPAPDVGSIWDEEWRQNLLHTAMQRVKALVAPRQYQMFDLYAVKEWPVREVARSLNVSAARVYLAKHRVSRMVRDELRRLTRQSEACAIPTMQSPSCASRAMR